MPFCSLLFYRWEMALITTRASKIIVIDFILLISATLINKEF